MYRKPAVQARTPTLDHLKKMRLLAKTIHFFSPLFYKIFFKNVEIVGREHLEKPGAKLILMNHSNLLDPAIFISICKEPVFLLVTESYMYERPISKLFAWLGHIPKRKLALDTRSIQTMKKWVDLGANVGFFPEGMISWTGVNSKVRPGTDQLVHYLNVPVIFIKVINADRFWPMWAKNKRRTTIRIEISPPHIFQKSDNVDSLIQEGISTRNAKRDHFPVTGKGLAQGLKNFFRYCPECFSDSTLIEKGNHLSCQSCEKKWVVSPNHKLAQIDFTQKVESIDEKWMHIKEYLTKQVKLGTTFRSLNQVELYDASKPQWKLLDQGVLELSNNTLKLNQWNLDVSEILESMHDWKTLILIRTKNQRLALDIKGESKAVWEHLITVDYKR